MQETHISDAITVGPQPTTLEQFEALHLRGFKTLVNLSRKGELGHALKPWEEEQLATDAGLDFIHLPVSLNTLKHDHVDEFLAEVRAHELPVYVHCRIGQRSGPFALIFHALRRGVPTDALLRKANDLGLRWRAPMITDFMKSYLERARSPELAA